MVSEYALEDGFSFRQRYLQKPETPRIRKMHTHGIFVVTMHLEGGNRVIVAMDGLK